MRMHVAKLVSAFLALCSAGGCGAKTTSPNPGGGTTPVVASVQVSPDSADALAGQAVQLTAIARDSTGQVLSGAVFTWESQHPARAQVADGLVGTLVAGRVLISVRAGVKADTAVIRVAPNPLDFESFPSGAPMCTNSCAVTGEYAARGVVFSFYRPYPIGLQPRLVRIGSANALTTHVVTVAADGGVWYSGAVAMDFPAAPDTVVFTLRGVQGASGSFLLVGVPAAQVQTLTSNVVDFGITGVLREDVVRVVRVGGLARVLVGDSTGEGGSAPMIDNLSIGP